MGVLPRQPTRAWPVRWAIRLVGTATMGLAYYFLVYPRLGTAAREFFRQAWTSPFFLAAMLCVLFLVDVTEYLRYRIESRLGGPFPTGTFRSEGIRKKYRELYGPTERYYLLYVALSWAIPLLIFAWAVPWFISLRR